MRDSAAVADPAAEAAADLAEAADHSEGVAPAEDGRQAGLEEESQGKLYVIMPGLE